MHIRLYCKKQSTIVPINDGNNIKHTAYGQTIIHQRKSEALM